MACEARQNGHRGPKDRTLHRGLEESCEAQGAEGQRVVKDELHRMYNDRTDGEIADRKPLQRRRPPSSPA